MAHKVGLRHRHLPLLHSFSPPVHLARHLPQCRLSLYKSIHSSPPHFSQAFFFSHLPFGHVDLLHGVGTFSIVAFASETLPAAMPTVVVVDLCFDASSVAVRFVLLTLWLLGAGRSGPALAVQAIRHTALLRASATVVGIMPRIDAYVARAANLLSGTLLPCTLAFPAGFPATAPVALIAVLWVVLEIHALPTTLFPRRPAGLCAGSYPDAASVLAAPVLSAVFTTPSTVPPVVLDVDARAVLAAAAHLAVRPAAIFALLSRVVHHQRIPGASILSLRDRGPLCFLVKVRFLVEQQVAATQAQGQQRRGQRHDDQ